jgi:hypothetical protein
VCTYLLASIHLIFFLVKLPVVFGSSIAFCPFAFASSLMKARGRSAWRVLLHRALHCMQLTCRGDVFMSIDICVSTWACRALIRKNVHNPKASIPKIIICSPVANSRVYRPLTVFKIRYILCMIVFLILRSESGSDSENCEGIVNS